MEMVYFRFVLDCLTIVCTAEFNFYADPEAAKICVDRLGSRLTLVPWETTLDSPFPWDWREESPLFAALVEKYHELVIERNGTCVLCDVLAAAVIVEKSIIAEKLEMAAKVLTVEEPGTILFDWYGKDAEAAKITVVAKLDNEAFLKLCRRVL